MPAGSRGGRRETLTTDEARRAVLAAQGFAQPARPTGRRAVVATVRRLGLVQVDSVNVLARAHYLPVFSRLGAYDVADLAAPASRAPRSLFEYWGHEASLLPVETQPLLRWRMALAHPWGGVAETMRTHPELVTPVLDAIASLGPLTVTQLESHLEHDEPCRTTDWGWNWSVVKRLVEGLFWSGAISSAGRDSSFRRRYALTEQVLPRAVLAVPTPTRRAAVEGLVAIAGRALGVATAADLRDYFRLPVADTRTAVADLVEAGVLLPVRVSGWPPAWRHRDLRVPRRVAGRRLLVPFDPLVWHRERVQRLFGMRYRIEIYTPAPRREFGYYVLPFLQGDRLRARVDLRADRRNGTLVVAGAWDHPDGSGRPGADPSLVAVALAELAAWLGLADVSVTGNGDLATPITAALRHL